MQIARSRILTTRFLRTTSFQNASGRPESPPGQHRQSEKKPPPNTKDHDQPMDMHKFREIYQSLDASSRMKFTGALLLFAVAANIAIEYIPVKKENKPAL